MSYCPNGNDGSNMGFWESLFVMLTIAAVFAGCIYGCGQGLHELAR